MIYDWLIVGGGIQGTTLATFLVKEKKTSIDKLIIVDPHEEPLDNWKSCTEKISMPYLRSPSVHHIDKNPFSLQSFVNSCSTGNEAEFYGRYKRPSLQIFNKHCDHIIEDIGLKNSWAKGKVVKIKKRNRLWYVYLATNEMLVCRNLVLAIGVGNQLSFPDWAIQAKNNNQQNIYHIFDKQLNNLENLEMPISIIGGGITAVHIAIKLSKLFPGNISLIKRHPFRVFDFDSDPSWLGPKKQYSFRKLTDYYERREQIKNARNRGSIPKELQLKIRMLQEKNKIIVINDSVTHYKDNFLYLENQPSILAKTVILATGFQTSLPEKEWLEPLIQEQNLKCAQCGYPIVSHCLQWEENLYVTGTLAELEVGPIARNISGARQAAQLIVKSL